MPGPKYTLILPLFSITTALSTGCHFSTGVLQKPTWCHSTIAPLQPIFHTAEKVALNQSGTCPPSALSSQCAWNTTLTSDGLHSLVGLLPEPYFVPLSLCLLLSRTCFTDSEICTVHLCARYCTRCWEYNNGQPRNRPSPQRAYILVGGADNKQGNK